MKAKKTLLFSFVLLCISMVGNAQEVYDFTVQGSCASYIQWNNRDFLNTVPYEIKKTTSTINIDGDADAAWNNANAKVIANIAHEIKGGVLNLNKYPQTEAYAKATFKALWTEDGGVYMFISVLDNNIVYQNPTFQWENDAIEFYFAQEVGAAKKQIIIPAMVGLKNPSYPAGPDVEKGSANGSNAAYKVFGYDAANWDETTFSWAIKKTAAGYDMEVYMDKDIATNGNSMTNYGMDKVFAGDINLDVAGTKKNTNTPALFVRECTLALLGFSDQEYSNSNYYGLFKMVDINSGINSVNDLQFTAIYNSNTKEISISSSASELKLSVVNLKGQIMPLNYTNNKIFASNLKQGVYIIKAIDTKGNKVGTQKLVIY